MSKMTPKELAPQSVSKDRSPHRAVRKHVIIVRQLRVTKAMVLGFSVF